MSQDFSLRNFDIVDFEKVIGLWKSAGIILSRSDNPESLKKKLERDPELFIVLEQDDTLLGTVMGTYDGRRGWINHLAVSPDAQGKGLDQILT
ncbi:MAG: GNAT family N-acetyltransferase, partial [Deinococcota bacterium]